MLRQTLLLLAFAQIICGDSSQSSSQSSSESSSESNEDLSTKSGSAKYNWDDPNQRYAPDYVISDVRRQKIRQKLFYWFYDSGGVNNTGDYITEINSVNPEFRKDLNFQLPFFGDTYDYVRVSINGYLGFSDAPVEHTYPLEFPIADWPRHNDPAFIGIFYSKCRIGRIRPHETDQRKPGVYFRLDRNLLTRTDRFGVELRERVMWDIREGVPGAGTFVPNHVAIITWKNMSFTGGIDISLYFTNTFQIVLTTDEIHTYAIFNYEPLNWQSPTEAGGDTVQGEGGVPAFVGFNAGNGTQAYEYLPYSQRYELYNLARNGFGNGFPGRHIFRIDNDIFPEHNFLSER